jgi:hypothetical protein
MGSQYLSGSTKTANKTPSTGVYANSRARKHYAKFGDREDQAFEMSSWDHKGEPQTSTHAAAVVEVGSNQDLWETQRRGEDDSSDKAIIHTTKSYTVLYD